MMFGKKGIHLKTEIPGKKSFAVLKKLKQVSGGWSEPLPFVFSGKGEGCYFQDIDGNRILDFASQICSNPLGYNHPRLLKVLKKYQHLPIKYAGQDFIVKEHLDLLEELVRISPGFDVGYLANSGAEAVENAIKIALRHKPTAKFGVSFEGAFHGRTLAALSCTNSKSMHKKNEFTLPMRRLPFGQGMKEAFERILEQEAAAEDIGFVIVEAVQGEGGYHIASHTMMQDLRKLCTEHRIPLIVDEVQSGMGRTGKWWAYENFDVHPDIVACAKALQVGAVLAKKNMFPKEAHAISSTWGGGHVLDMALGMETIHIIRDEKLLEHNAKMGRYLVERLFELPVMHPRGLGLMCAFDVDSRALRVNVALQAAKSGLAVMGCGTTGIRLIPPYLVTEKEIDEAVDVLHEAISLCDKKGFAHKGKICEVIGCPKN